mgnify:CR=1 FL=1
MAEIIVQDIYGTFAYLGPGLFSTVLLTMVMVILRYFHSKSYSMADTLKCMVLIFYLVMLVQIALLSREPGSRTTTDLIPFSTWGTSAQSRAYEYENILMFLPMGFLLPAFFKLLRRLYYVVVVLILFSCVIEITQFVTQRGFLQTDDVIMNTIGGIGGYFIWKIVNRIFGSKDGCRGISLPFTSKLH